MHQPSPSPGRPLSAHLVRMGSQPSSLDTLASSLFIKKPVSDMTGFVSPCTDELTTMARSIDRAAMQRLRAQRLHDEERQLETAERVHKASYTSIALNTPPMSATPPSSALFETPGVVSRTELQRLRAARMHAEERLLNGDKTEFAAQTLTGSETGSEIETGGGGGPLRRTVSGESVQGPDDGADDTVVVVVGRVALQARTNVFMTNDAHTNNRTKMQKVRATRLRDEEIELESAEARRREARDGLPKFTSTLSGGGAPRPDSVHRAMQKHRASRMRTEERTLYDHDRRRLQQMRAQRLHDEERTLESASMAAH
eukprot:m.162939 g.162939  ORF g.162939 m.162939 type:complete len:314 (-) comp12248_c0_seq1:130-1071(-)